MLNGVYISNQKCYEKFTNISTTMTKQICQFLWTSNENEQETNSKETSIVLRKFKGSNTMEQRSTQRLGENRNYRTRN